MTVSRAVCAPVLVGSPNPFLGVVVKKTSFQNIGVGAFAPLTWNEAIYDRGSWFSGAGSTILTVPNGVRCVKIFAGVAWATTAGSEAFISFRHNGGIVFGLPQSSVSGKTIFQSLASPVIEVVPGDEFHVVANHDFASPVSVTSNEPTFFAAQAVG